MLRYKIHFIWILSTVLLIGCAHSRYGRDVPDKPSIRHDLPVIKEGDRWEVRNPRVTKGDTLIWVAPETSDLSFQFPNNIGRYLRPLNEENDYLTDGYLKNLKAGNSLNLVVKKNAPLFRILEYAIFVVNDGKYAEGDSPPEIIFEW